MSDENPEELTFITFICGGFGAILLLFSIGWIIFAIAVEIFDFLAQELSGTVSTGVELAKVAIEVSLARYETFSQILADLNGIEFGFFLLGVALLLMAVSLLNAKRVEDKRERKRRKEED